jgi:hypothetical protein
VRVLRKKIKDSKHKTRVLPKPNIQKLILDLKITYKGLGYYFQTFTQKNATPTFSHGGEGGANVGFKE